MKGIVLSSGGADSTTCIAIAIKELGAENVSTVSINYGQRNIKELNCAEKIADYYHLKHYLLDLREVFKYSSCPLLAGRSEPPQSSYKDQLSPYGVPTNVPLRNGIFLMCLGSLAMSLYPEQEVRIYIGNHASDWEGNAYADCSPEFTKAIHEAISVGSYNCIQMVSPLLNLSKGEVIREGLALGIPYHLTWSCYNCGEKACGKCGSCRTRLEAFRSNGVEDPLEYEVR